jgi:hypothetical protein
MTSTYTITQSDFSIDLNPVAFTSGTSGLIDISFASIASPDCLYLVAAVVPGANDFGKALVNVRSDRNISQVLNYGNTGLSFSSNGQYLRIATGGSQTCYVSFIKLT